MIPAFALDLSQFEHALKLKLQRNKCDKLCFTSKDLNVTQKTPDQRESDKQQWSNNSNLENTDFSCETFSKNLK